MCVVVVYCFMWCKINIIAAVFSIVLHCKCVCVVCVSVHSCVCERERERVCVCVCVCVPGDNDSGNVLRKKCKAKRGREAGFGKSTAKEHKQICFTFHHTHQIISRNKKRNWMTFYCGVTYTGHTFFINFSTNDCSTNNNFQFFTCIQLNTSCITQTNCTDCTLTGVHSWRRK